MPTTQLAPSQYDLLHRITTRIRQSLHLREILQTTVTEVRAFLQIDRVLVYRFYPDEHGKVIAEAIDNHHLPSLMGLHFPADDIPHDPVESCHVEYLKAMGVQASVVMPIMQEGKLWGLLVADHRQPRLVFEAEWHFLELVVDQVTISIAQSTVHSQMQSLAYRESIANRIATLLHCGSANPFQAALDAIVNSINASGGRLFLSPTDAQQVGEVYTCGTQPIVPETVDHEVLEHFALWQTSVDSTPIAITNLYEDERCFSLIKAFQSTPIRSLLILPLQRGQSLGGYLTLFRDEVEAKWLWARKSDPDDRQDVTRQSFEQWQERKTKQAQGWTQADLNLVRGVAMHFASAIGQYQLQAQVQALNASLEQVQHRTREIDNIQFAPDQSSTENTLFRLAAIVESSEDAIISKTLDDKISSWNAGAERVFGYTRDEVIGQPITVLIPRDRWDEEREILERLNRGERIEHFETIRQRKDGTLIDISLTVSPLKDPTGAIVGYSKIARDITKQQAALRVRQQTEKALQSQTRLFNLVVNSISDGIIVADQQGQFLVFNPAAEQMFGSGAIDTSQDEWAQQYGLFLPDQETPFPPDELPLVRAIRGEESKDVEMFVRHAQMLDGGWVLINGRPLRDESEQIQGGVIVCRDISDRKQTEAALAESEAKFRHLVENATDLIWSSTLDGTLTYLSPRFKKMTGFDPSEFLGRSLAPLVHPADLSGCLAFLQRVLETGEQQNGFEFRHQHQDGHWFWVSSNVSPVKNELGEVVGFQGILQDIDDRKHTELILLEREEQLRQFVEHAPISVIMLDQDMRYLIASQQWLQDFNLKAEDVIGRSHYDIFPEITDEWRQIHQRCLSGVVEKREEDPFLRADGSLDWVRWAIHPWYQANGDVGGIIMFTEIITERKRAEQKLRQTLDMLDLASDSIIIRDMSDRIVYWNQGAENLYGWKREEVLGQYIHTFLQTVFPESLEVTLAEFFERGQWEGELHHITREGRHIIVGSRWTLQRDASGQPFAQLEINSDITQRKHAEAALKQSEERYRSLTTATAQIVWMTNVEGRIADMPAWRALTGQSEAEVAGFGWLDAIHPDDRERTSQIWLEAVRTKNLYETEYRIRAADGTYRYFAARGVPVVDSNGCIREWIGTCTDIHDRKEAEIALRQSEERLQAILDNSPAVIYLKDLQGRLIMVNRQFESLFHLTRSEIIGKRDCDLLAQEFAEVIAAIDQKVLEAGTAIQSEEVVPHEDGLHTYLSLKFPLLTSEGKPYALCGISTDITERKQAELALEQAKEAAEAANQAKSEFLANMSHELRTPLNGVIGYAQILQRTKTLTEEDRSRVEVIHQCGTHLLTLINDILDLSKIEARKVELMPTDFHLPAFLQGVAEMCRIRAELKGIQFHYESAPELPIGIRADEKRLRQVLINLLSNGIKFTDAGNVTFTVSYGREGRIRFAVRDTGIGIPQEKLESIFQPFEQVSDAKRQSEGTGLGLAISQEIVQLMDSTIEVQSEVGVGSIFWFDVTLPQAEEWVKAAQSDRHGQIIGIQDRQPKVLVVDDKWENRSVIANLLSPIGFEVLEATDGKDGWQKVSTFCPDLVITDLLMPDSDGFELINQIRASDSFKDLIIIVSSASVFEADQYRSIEAGGNDFLPKPVLAADLLEKLQKHLQRLLLG